MQFVHAVLKALAAFSLVAIGVHAGADCVDDRLLRAATSIDQRLDELFAKWNLTAPLVDVVTVSTLTKASRAAAMVLELLLDVSVGLSVFAYETKSNANTGFPNTMQRVAALQMQARQRWRAQRRHQAPELIANLTRPLLALVFVLAGANAVGRLTQATVELSLLHKLGSLAVLLGRLCGLWALGACLVVLGVDAVAAALSNTEDDSMRESRTLQRELSVLALAALPAYLALTESISLGAYLS